MVNALDSGDTMQNFIAIALLLTAFPTQAATPGRPPHMTGDQFLDELRARPGTPRLFDQYYARGYMAGVADATQGVTWCLPTNLPPETADEQVLEQLAKRPSDSMPGIASALLLEQYRTNFPKLATHACDIRPRLTGNDYQSKAAGNRRTAGNNGVPDQEVEQQARFSNGYLGGVIDATQGKSWCAPARIKPSELDAIGYWALVDQAPGSIPGNAATLLLQHFIAKYPCRSSQ